MMLTAGSTIRADQEPSTRDLAPVRDKLTDPGVLVEPLILEYTTVYARLVVNYHMQILLSVSVCSASG